jgi:nitrite reductase/ring-hydroxylating ferredoxin subunit
MSATRLPVADVPPGSVTGSGGYAVGNNGEYFAVSRRCRHLRADLADGSIDADGCLVCPWHRSKYDVRTGRMTRGPQGVFAKIPGFDAANIALTKVWPLRRGNVTVDGNELQVD